MKYLLLDCFLPSSSGFCFKKNEDCWLQLYTYHECSVSFLLQNLEIANLYSGLWCRWVEIGDCDGKLGFNSRKLRFSANWGSWFVDFYGFSQFFWRYVSCSVSVSNFNSIILVNFNPSSYVHFNNNNLLFCNNFMYFTCCYLLIVRYLFQLSYRYKFNFLHLATKKKVWFSTFRIRMKIP